MKKLVIIPTYNERENIKILIKRICTLLPDVSILVVDDSSPDGTADEVRTLMSAFPRLDLLIRNRKEGLGRAYMDAFGKISDKYKAERIIIMDGDLSHEPSYLPEMLEASKNFGLVIGSRYVQNGGTVGWEFWRRALSRGGNFYCRILAGININDWTSGFNVIDAKFLQQIDFSHFNYSGYAFLIELKHALIKAGARPYEVPIIFKNRTGGESKISSHIISEGIVAPWRILFKKNGSKDAECRLCRGNATLYTRKNDCDFFRCTDCGLLFVWPVPVSTDNVYTVDYFSGAKAGFGYTDYEKDKEAMKGTFDSYLDYLDFFLNDNKRSLMDIGAGTGFFLNLAKTRGWQVSGIEISEWAAAMGRKKGLNIKTGDLLASDLSDTSPDAVTLLDVIEHLPDPVIGLNKIGAVLRSQGIILINTPDAGSIYSRLTGRYWHSIIPPEHVILFNKYNLSEFLKNNGFEIVYTGKVAKKFTLQYCAAITANWLKSNALKKIAGKLQDSRLGKIAIPLNLWDNLLIIARKI